MTALGRKLAPYRSVGAPEHLQLRRAKIGDPTPGILTAIPVGRGSDYTANRLDDVCFYRLCDPPSQTVSNVVKRITPPLENIH